LLHHVTVDLLREGYYALKRDAAPGVDEVTWKQYGEGLEGRLEELHGRIHRGSYRAQPSKRTYILKPDGKQRPLGIMALEDKVAQKAMVMVLNAIYEEDFLGFSYGSRPGRKPHDALDAIWTGIQDGKVNWVLDADISGFFDTIDHGWLIKFLEHRIADQRVLRLIRKWLTAGVSEEGTWSKTDKGIPQGSVISPLLANVYLHYVLDTWAHAWRKKNAKGEVKIVRYVDDFVMGFQRHDEAERFLKELQERMQKFGLSLHPEKTRLIEFGRFAAQNRQNRGQGKPETFTFLGFLHICSQTRDGKFLIRRKTARKRMSAKLKEIRQLLMIRRHWPVKRIGAWLRSVLQGYFNYFAVPGNIYSLGSFRTQVIWHWLQALRRRSQRAYLTWERFSPIIRAWIPVVRVLHPYPNVRFYAKYPR
jgi:group II intron reverse transcriptase/maturase